MVKKIILKCANCNKEFEKSAGEHKRQLKIGKGKRFFCNMECSKEVFSREIKPHPNPQNLVADNRRDEFTPFRWFVLRAKPRDKKKNRECNITVEYLSKLWEEQKGICPFTGWKLNLPYDTKYVWREKSIANASLDRIDGSLGYIEGNVRFVSIMANLARGIYKDEQVIAFCKAVTAHASNTEDHFDL